MWKSHAYGNYKLPLFILFCYTTKYVKRRIHQNKNNRNQKSSPKLSKTILTRIIKHRSKLEKYRSVSKWSSLNDQQKVVFFLLKLFEKRDWKNNMVDNIARRHLQNSNYIVPKNFENSIFCRRKKTNQIMWLIPIKNTFKASTELVFSFDIPLSFTKY